MGFMQPEIWEGDFYSVDGPMGTEYIPLDVCGDLGAIDDADFEILPEGLQDYCENRSAYMIERIHGFGARLSAPGYLDCTETCVFPTLVEAQAYIRETYDMDPDTGEDLNDEDSED